MRLTGIETRMTGIETRLVAVEPDLAAIKAVSQHYATKAGALAAKNAITMWIVGGIFLARLVPSLMKQLGL